MEINNKTFEDYAKILREAVPYNDNIAKIKFVTKADKMRRDRIKKYTYALLRPDMIIRKFVNVSKPIMRRNSRICN